MAQSDCKVNLTLAGGITNLNTVSFLLLTGKCFFLICENRPLPSERWRGQTAGRQPASPQDRVGRLGVPSNARPFIRRGKPSLASRRKPLIPPLPMPWGEKKKGMAQKQRKSRPPAGLCGEGMVGWAKEEAGRALSTSETSSPRAAHIHSFKAAVIKNQRDGCSNHQRPF